MHRLARSTSHRQVNYVGYSLPIKDILGVGHHPGEETPEMAAVLGEKGKLLMRRVFDKPDPSPTEVEARI